ncbi:MAG TPA: TMEM175 family protein [Gammaproteobacteria bacterium]|jgi:uncharacterized membrane protein|nr:TMEM175 family protein [Gammaproteobacteria bacterium]
MDHLLLAYLSTIIKSMASEHLLKLSRLASLSDGVFAIAMTIIILNLHVPMHLPDQNLQFLLHDEIYANLFIYIGTFIILGTHWIAMNFQWGLLVRLNRPYLWANIFYLMVICVIPFSANLLGVYRHSVESIYFYAVNLLCSSLGQLLILCSAYYFNLNKSTCTPAIYRAALLRILVAPIFYVSSLILAHWTTEGCFILLVLPTLIYMIPGKIDKYEHIGKQQ